jgi:hypothetical protein
MSKALLTVVEMDGFVEDARTVFTLAEREALVSFLAEHPDAGDLIPGSGGARKLRWGAKGKGKRGGARVVTYYADLRLPVFLLACFAKGEKADMSPKQRAELKTTLKAIADDYRGSKNR